MGNLSNLYISQSFISLIHLGGDNTASVTPTELQDGLGNGIGIYVNTSGSVSASSYSGSVNGIGNVSAFSTSVDSRLDNLELFSSSLDATFATDAQLNASSSTLQANINTKLDTASFNTFSSSNFEVNVSQSQQISASFATASAYSASLQTSILAVSNSVSTSTVNTTALSASIYQTDTTQSFQIGANAATASGFSASLSTTITNNSASTFQTDATQSNNINNLTALTSSYARINQNNTYSAGTTQSFDSITALSASITYLKVIFQTSSVVYSSGSNILGDNANDDVQTLIGRNILTGSAEVTGSLRVTSDISSSTLNGIGNVTLYSASVAASITSSTANVTLLSQSLYFTDTTQSNNIASNSSSIGLLQTFSASSDSRYVRNSQTSSMAVSSSTYSVTSSYAVNGGVTQLLAGPNIIVSPLSGKGQVTISSTGTSTGSFNTATGSYGSFYDTTTQPNPVANTANSMSFNETAITNGVSISGSTNPFNTYIKTENAGVYNLQFSAQLDKIDSGTDSVDIWIRKNGIDLLDTGTTVTLTGNNDKSVAAWNWFVQSAANDYYQIIWASADTDMRLLAEASSSVHPGIPSVIATINRVDQFLSNTGSFTGSFNGYNLTEFTTTSSFNAFTQSISSSVDSISSSVGLLQTFSSSQYKNDSSSFDSRIDSIETAGYVTAAITASSIITASVSQSTITFTKGNGSTFNIVVADISGSTLDTGSLVTTASFNAYTQSTNTFTASISTSVGLLQEFSSSEYKADSSSFDSRINSIVAGTGFLTTASFNAYTQSTNDFTASITSSYNATSSSLNSVSSSLLEVSSSLLAVSASLLTVSGTVYTNTNSIIGINAKTASFATTGSNSFIGNQTITGSLILSSSAATELQIIGGVEITGSVAGNITALSVASSTASIDFNLGTFFTLTIPSSTITYITGSNLKPGQTANIILTQQVTTGSVRFESTLFKFPSGSINTGSAIASAVDMVSVASVNSTTLYSVTANRLI